MRRALNAKSCREEGLLRAKKIKSPRAPREKNEALRACKGVIGKVVRDWHAQKGFVQDV